MKLSEARSLLEALQRHAEPRPGRVHLELRGPVAELVLDNPGARGALTLGMMVELAAAVERLASWDGAVVLLSSRDPRPGPGAPGRRPELRAFCAGGHLGQVRRAISDPERAEAMCLAMSAVLDGLLDLPAVSVALIDGLAIGGGAELATATDLRLLSPSASLHFVHAALGIAPGWGGTRRLVGLLGRRRALALLLDARPLSADEALALGLADEVHADLRAAADRLVERWLSRPPEAIRALKRQVVAGVEGDRAADAAAFAEVWGGPAHRAALDALGKPAR